MCNLLNFKKMAIKKTVKRGRPAKAKATVKTTAKRGRPATAKATTTATAKRGRPSKSARRLNPEDCGTKLLTSRLEGGYSLKKRVRKPKMS
jgi:hypothetical protein